MMKTIITVNSAKELKTREHERDGQSICSVEPHQLHDFWSMPRFVSIRQTGR